MLRLTALGTALLCACTLTPPAAQQRIGAYGEAESSTRTISSRDPGTQSDRLKLSRVPSAEPGNPFPDSASGERLYEHLQLMGTPSPTLDEARRRFLESLTNLQVNSSEHVKTLKSGYERLDERDYFLRWSLIALLADLESPDAYDLLSDLAATPLPKERNADTHHGSTQERELMIRLRAVEGLSRLATRGSIEAGETLYRLATEGKDGTGVQLRAIKGFLRASGNPGDRIETLRKVLPDSLHGLLTTETTRPEMFDKTPPELAAGSYTDTSSGDDESPPPIAR